LASLTPDIEVANFYNLINAMGMVRNDGGFVSETGTSKLYKLYRPAFPGEMLPLAVESPQFDEGTPHVEAMAVRTADGTYVYLCNRSSGSSISVQVDGLSGKIGSAAMLRAEAMDAPFAEAQPPAVD